MAADFNTYSLKDIRDALSGHAPDTGPSEKADRNASVAMVLSEKPTGSLSALFIQRAEHPNDPWSGQMALPGGRVEPHDDTLHMAAMRETQEEVGLDLHEDMKLGRLHDIYGGRLTSQRLAVSPFVFYHPDPPELTPNYEVADTVWVPLEYMGRPGNIEPYVFHLDPDARDFPSIQYEGYTIWGLTYRILTNFYNLFDIDLPGESETTDVE